jgi:hypothetical protein
MVRKPADQPWQGFTQPQARLLDFLDHLGNNGWAGNSQSEKLMPNLMRDLYAAGLSVERAKEATATALSGSPNELDSSVVTQLMLDGASATSRP